MIVRMDSSLPTIPYDIADGVELWARQQGRHARMEWNAVLGCPVIHFTRRPDDPMMREWQEGRLSREPTESVILNRWDAGAGRFVPLDLGEYGAQGIVNLLEEANLWSGRGAYGSLQEAIRAAQDRNDRVRDDLRSAAFEAGQAVAQEMRRTILQLPQVQVVADLQSQSTGDER